MFSSKIEMEDCNGSKFCLDVERLGGTQFIKVIGGSLIIKELDHKTPPMDCLAAESCDDVADKIFLVLPTNQPDQVLVATLCERHHKEALEAVRNGIRSK